MEEPNSTGDRKEDQRGVRSDRKRSETDDNECLRAAKRPMGANAGSSKTEAGSEHELSHRTVKLPNSQQQLGQRASQPPVGSDTVLQGLLGPRRL